MIRELWPAVDQEAAAATTAAVRAHPLVLTQVHLPGSTRSENLPFF